LSAEIVRSVIDAVAVDGFMPRLAGGGIELHGVIKAGVATVPMYIRFEDVSFVSSPRCFLPDVSMLGRKVVPHLDDAGEFCVVDRQTVVFDRYRAPEQTRGLIVRAKEVLERGMGKAGTSEIAQEFHSYWSRTYFEFQDNPINGSVAADALNIGHVTTANTLSFDPHHTKPDTLGELLEWASYWDSSLDAKILSALARLSPNDPMVEIHAVNTTIIAQIMASRRGPKFLQTLSRPKSWKRFINSLEARALAIERMDGRRTDFPRIFGMNGPQGEAPLVGRKIVLIGCGAIGGYLARMLIQTGAGLDARFFVIDPDKLSKQNIRRHQLGVADLGRFKAEACAEALGRDFPGIDIFGIAAAAQQQVSILESADLVIDATGEQEFSDWLNEWALARRKSGEACPALLFAWIAGNGVAAQSFLSIDNSYACYRCLQPDLAKPGRFDPLKEQTIEAVAPCGDQPITRYGPAASTAAAGLACSHATDWALNHPHHLLRTIRIDWEASVRRDPKSPERAGDCPACGHL
jgi:molybdopterin/thiamine biosynthesis adenylyltransferase